jgi:hypothetical protein
MKLLRFAFLALPLGLASPGYMKEAPIPASGADEVVFRPTNREYPREHDLVVMKVQNLADVAQIYADFSKKEVRVPRDLLDRSEGIASTSKSRADYVIRGYEWQLPAAGIEIVLLGRDAVAFRPDMAYREKMEAKRPASASPELVAAASAAMSLDRFWQLIEAAGRARGGGSEFDSFRMAEALEAVLVKLQPEDILGFQLRLNERMAECYRWDLWAVAYIVNGGASDDGFVYFCGWLISQGRAYYETALKYPVRAADRAGRLQQNENEQLLYAAMQAYQTKAGKMMPQLPYHGAGEPAGKAWAEEDLPKLYPELTKRF